MKRFLITLSFMTASLFAQNSSLFFQESPDWKATDMTELLIKENSALDLSGDRGKTGTCHFSSGRYSGIRERTGKSCPVPGIQLDHGINRSRMAGHHKQNNAGRTPGAIETVCPDVPDAGLQHDPSALSGYLAYERHESGFRSASGKMGNF